MSLSIQKTFTNLPFCCGIFQFEWFKIFCLFCQFFDTIQGKIRVNIIDVTQLTLGCAVQSLCGDLKGDIRVSGLWLAKNVTEKSFMVSNRQLTSRNEQTLFEANENFFQAYTLTFSILLSLQSSKKLLDTLCIVHKCVCSCRSNINREFPQGEQRRFELGRRQ